jgi:hypothetical protein
MSKPTTPDNAFKAIQQIRVEFSDFAINTPAPTEADTRANLIDRILTEVCGWPEQLIRREEHVSVGYIDYTLLIRSRPYVAVEAKKTGVSFTLPTTSSRTLKLPGPILTDKPVADALKQVRSYCDEGGIRYGITTNGHAWIIFRAIREDMSWRDGHAHVFHSLDNIEANFTECDTPAWPTCDIYIWPTWVVSSVPHSNPEVVMAAPVEVEPGGARKGGAFQAERTPGWPSRGGPASVISFFSLPLFARSGTILCPSQ